jgi:hypothetical protein
MVLGFKDFSQSSVPLISEIGPPTVEHVGHVRVGIVMFEQQSDITLYVLLLTGYAGDAWCATGALRAPERESNALLNLVLWATLVHVFI